MEIVSHNEEDYNKLAIRHIFFPSTYAFIAEATVAIVTLIVFNANELSNRLLASSLDESNPFAFSTQLLNQSWTETQQIYIIQQTLIFLLWAMVGTLTYILIFRILQILFGIKYSVGKGVKLIRREHYSGILKWFNSLHDFFLKALLVFFGVSLLVIGAFVCFSIASQELRAGLLYQFPSNILPLVIAFVSVLLSARLTVLGISLFSPAFRNWYAE
jgi:hypothetical protein